MSYGISNKSKYVQKSTMIGFGTILVACSYFIFQEPNGIVAPGLGGLVMLLSQMIHIPIGVLYFICNIPLFLIGYRTVGAEFAVLSLVGMSCLSIFLSLFSSLPELHQPLIGCVASGVFAGIGIGIVIRAGGTTGGLDIASVVISRTIPFLTIGKTMMIVNALVLGCSFIGEGIVWTSLTFVSMIIASKCVDWTLSYNKQIQHKGGETNE